MRDRFMAPGYVTADQIREGDPYEVSDGHRIECLPTGARGGRANLVGASVLDTDPAVKSAAIDTGFSPNRRTLRAPDIAVGDIPDEPGWVPGAPPLAVEYADIGQDEGQLQQKIKDLFASTTQFVWVVRMEGLRRVEVYEKGLRMRIAHHHDMLLAPGILDNPVPVAALYDRQAAHEATLRNLLQRKGFQSLEDVAAKAAKKAGKKARKEGRAKGRKLGLEEGLLEGQRRTVLRQLRTRFGELPEAVVARVESASPEVLDVWTDRVLSVTTLDDVIA